MEIGCEYSQLIIPNDLSYAPIAGAYVGSVSDQIGFDEHDRTSLQAAIIEAIRTIIENIFEPGDRQTLTISCERVPGGLKISIREKGLPFDPEELIRHKSGLSSGTRRTDAGMFLMRDVVDEVVVHNLGPEGTEIHLIKYLRNQTLDDYIAACEPERFRPPSRSRKILKKSDFRVRLMRAGEAVEVAKLIYRAYGYSYFYEYAYYPERIIDLNASGEMISALAVTSEGEIAGHCAIFNSEEDSGVAEIGLAVVRPEFRGSGCLLELTKFLLNQAQSKGFSALYIRAVTAHTFSQRVARRLGFETCAILLGYIASTVSFKEINEQLSQRETFVVAYQYIQETDDIRIYAPLQHRSFITKVYKHLGVNAKTIVPENHAGTAPTGESVFKIKSSFFMPAGVATIEIIQYGANILSEIRSLLKQLCLKRYDLIVMYLNMCDPGTFYLTEEFERLGFFFSGILPGVSGGEALILQYLNNVPIDYGQIKIHSKIGREILDYISQKDPNRG